MSHDDTWLNETSQRALRGDADANIALGWEYVRGDLVTRDFERAYSHFRAAEASKPRLARFNLAKAKLINGDASFSADIATDCENGYGPSLYLMGAAIKKGVFGSPDTPTSLEYFKAAARAGHLVSQFLVWRLGSKGILQFASGLFSSALLLLKIMRIKISSPDDERIMT